MTNENKTRHGCLTAWLIFMIIANSIASMLYIFGQSFLKDMLEYYPEWAIYTLSTVALLNVVFAVLLLKWKRIGFWGFCITAISVFIINIYVGTDMVTSIQGLLSVPILFGILHIGQENKGWPQLT